MPPPLKRLLVGESCYQHGSLCIVRCFYIYYTTLRTHFNPRTHIECDLLELKKAIPHLYFSPSTHEGGDQNHSGFSGYSFVLQSTHPHRVRLKSLTTGLSTTSYFNPRIRKGCDSHRRVAVFELLYFNPRTRKGCDNIVMDRMLQNR
ncbi:hypothetical protein D3C81_1666840 [compost metagenome]